MNKVNPLYLVKKLDEQKWSFINFDDYQNCLLVPTILETRILYSEATYEALQNERMQLRKIVFELFNNEQFFELPASLKDSIAAIVNGDKL